MVNDRGRTQVKGAHRGTSARRLDLVPAVTLNRGARQTWRHDGSAIWKFQSLGLGCNNFGWKIDEHATRAVIDAAIDSGINFFDTSDTYGKTKSEEFIGRALEGRRESVIIATKFGKPVDAMRTGAKPAYVYQACNDSLQRLRTDYIDLYQLHAPDRTVPIADTLGALNELVIAGQSAGDRMLQLLSGADSRSG